MPFTETERTINNLDAQGRYQGPRVSMSSNIAMAFTEDGKVSPHPDGKSWDTCCIGPGETKSSDSCQCFCRKTHEGKSRRDMMMDGNYASTHTKESLLRLAQEGGRFFCCHRMTDDGFHRECAGWAAKYAKERTPNG